MKTKLISPISYSYAFVAIIISSAELFAQARPGRHQPAEPSLFESFGFWAAIAAAAGLAGLFFFFRKSRKAEEGSTTTAKADDGVRMTYRDAPKKPAAAKPDPENVKAEPAGAKAGVAPHNFKRLQRTNPYIQWPESTDAALLAAINQTNEESEEDVQTRTNALRLLAAYKNSNAVTAIAQVALYDLSSKLRSDAVSVLADFDHESVFETIVTACADPTREVRAAAARALFKLSFDRGHSWTRIIESGDVSRMRHAARCAIEGDLVNRSFDRLVHQDRNVAYEAFALAALLVKAGETEPLYDAIESHRDENVKLGILNVLQVIAQEDTPEELSRLMERSSLTPNVAAKANEVRSMLQMSHA